MLVHEHGRFHRESHTCILRMGDIEILMLRLLHRGKVCRGEIWRIDSFQAIGEKELILTTIVG